MKTIRIKEVGILLDDSDYTDFANKKIHIGTGGYARTYLRGKSTLLHRIIMGAKKGEMLDHKNGNRLDNRKENLRFCTSFENNRNAKTRKDSSTGFKGVSWHKGTGRFQAKIKVNKKWRHLGYFPSAVEAAKMYNTHAVKLHKDFAWVNTI